MTQSSNSSGMRRKGRAHEASGVNYIRAGAFGKEGGKLFAGLVFAACRVRFGVLAFALPATVQASRVSDIALPTDFGYMLRFVMAW